MKIGYEKIPSEQKNGKKQKNKNNNYRPFLSWLRLNWFCMVTIVYWQIRRIPILDMAYNNTVWLTLGEDESPEAPSNSQILT